MSLNWGLCIILFIIPFAICKFPATEQTFEQCSKKFKTGKEINFNQLTGDWYPIYYWPKWDGPEECLKATFKEVAHSDISPICKEKIPEDVRIMQSTFSTKQKTVTQYVYGEGELKHFSLDLGQLGKECEIHKGMWRDLGNGYTLVTICPFSYNALMARNLTSYSELQLVIDSIDTLKGTEGVSACF